MKLLLLALALVMASGAQSEPLTVRIGESWLFTVRDGQPAEARKAAPSAKPGKGELMVSVRAMLGTSMVVTNNSGTAYTFNAELIRGAKRSAARSCTLPSGGRPIFERWEQQADAVRIGNFRPSGSDGRC